jgi:Ser/Thr protein kinase RdoA (MazF antagonist)
MRPFAELTRGGQVRRLKQLAETALTAYDLGDIHLTPLAHFFNTTFRIDSRPHAEDSAVQRYVMRIHRPGPQNAQIIQSELLWLQTLRRDTSLPVPIPVPTRTGDLVTCVSSPGVAEPRLCVVFQWVDGRFLRARLGVKELERVGTFMAKLHQHAEQFIAPTGFQRHRWDYEGLTGKALGTDLEQSWAHLSQEDRHLLHKVGDIVRRTMDNLGQERAVFGLIHADLYERNYLFFGTEVHAIDFDSCGWGHYLFDIGVAFSTLLARNDYPALRQAFLTGYRQQRPLSREHEALIDTFVAGRLLCHVLWLAAHINEPAYGERARRRIAYELGELRSFLEKTDHNR